MESVAVAAYCGLLRLIAVYCGLLQLIAVYCGFLESAELLLAERPAPVRKAESFFLTSHPDVKPQ